MRALGVSEINAQIKSILESTFMDICVRGEISSVTIHTSGHIYLTLKDENSSVRCVMFKGNARSLKIKLEVGQCVLIMGSLSVYVPKGEYQILCKSITLAGLGELSQAYEALKTKLSAKGYFESAHKKSLPKFPKRIALLTSATGAAKEDMLKVAHKRWNLVHITLFNTLVQGEGAKDSIVENLKRADSFFGTSEGFDVIVLGRGGGSMEDMWAFNEECVADAIYSAQTPIISAVGHEIDVFISDFVADVRAPTPSAAMEMLLPDKNEYLRILDEMMNTYFYALKQQLVFKSDALERVREYFKLYNFEQRYYAKIEQIHILKQMMQDSMNAVLEDKIIKYEHILSSLKMRREEKIQQCQYEYERMLEVFNALNPRSLCTRGYAQISKDGKACKISDIHINEEFYLSDITHSILAKRLQ
ncbi:exodeoxyribonuclease VII large subunit [Helicobacter sp. MIT 21-1697]|uniref:exodeoxyribonuclease VII large subunit n=1 Tax=Helicobacter sp. MIT 21-1697 TaxID=2993733 RepID=UPI00224AA8DA|nr:exodeoxyribonuclease VII large subunit [Helicobacter sp. MIT 21-1697]MCX2716717.1 exodeoxyribonuclease VII large subunit [Helicobacter sp. MIT 21-1697]